jgi:hypothetical protein
MSEIDATERKKPGRATMSPDDKLLVGREEAAEMLSISCRALDYLVANKQLLVRRIGTRVLIPSLSFVGSHAATTRNVWSAKSSVTDSASPS